VKSFSFSVHFEALVEVVQPRASANEANVSSNPLLDFSRQIFNEMEGFDGLVTSTSSEKVNKQQPHNPNSRAFDG
jgi:hypothetical protein